MTNGEPSNGGRAAGRRTAIALVLLALVALAAWQNRRLTDARRAGLPGAPAYAMQAPPFLNFLVVGLGGFRGIAAEILWSRSERLQDEGRYLELVQLADWITWLDPHAVDAWNYNAWNMAYNISAMMRRPEDRLRWVAHGIMLLRDEGLPANPHNARIRRELAWFYQHKIGSNDDAAHATYQFSLAEALAPCVRDDGTVDATPANRAALAAMRLDADRMRALERRFGPLDWRCAESHAVYWASEGLELAHGPERLACRRAIYQPLLLALQSGRFAGDLKQGVYRAVPNPALLAPTVRFLGDTARQFPTRGTRTAYAGLLVLAIREAHAAGDDVRARQWYADLGPACAGVLPLPPYEELAPAPPAPPR